MKKTTYIFKVSRSHGEYMYILKCHAGAELPEGVFEDSVPERIVKLCELLGIDPELDLYEYFEVVIPDSYMIVADDLK